MGPYQSRFEHIASLFSESTFFVGNLTPPSPLVHPELDFPSLKVAKSHGCLPLAHAARQNTDFPRTDRMF